MGHYLESEIHARGLQRAALDHDMRAAINRWQWTKNDDEIATLVPDQLIMLIISGNIGPESPLWSYTEQRLGRPLPKEKHGNAE